ncbi:MAG TPA: hypothetical protein VM535_01600 [Candidatus Saccharimonadales bacterium]|nr:hypothetical protein [Candidatus Saccharimonadales bacterium]
MANSKTNGFTRRCQGFLGSRKCFLAILALFGVQAAWIALSGRYPMAFDENFHLGLIRLYADHPSPFWGAQPAGADIFGAVVRDPSYLYHWLMSFPYRLIAAFTADQSTQVLWLRFLNIGLFAAALPLYRRLLLKTGASRAIVHGCLAVFVLIPIVPLLAAQLNYDNLLLPLTALVLLLTVKFSEDLGRGRLNVTAALQLTIIALLACLVKYAFLPIALVAAAYLLIRLWQAYHGRGTFRTNLVAGWRSLNGVSRTLLLTGLLVSLGLFAQRYAVNLAQYHKPVADCAQVLSAERCRAYSPWVRDQDLEDHKPSGASRSPLAFTGDWFYGMWLRSFFAVDGPATDFQTRGPLVLPGIGAVVFGAIAAVAPVITWPKLTRRYNRRVIWLFVAVTAGYAAVLWLDGYQSFLQTGQAVAINGRYLLPVMPLLLILLALGVNTLLGRRQTAKLAFGGAALLCLIWGGGALTYILRSNTDWYRPNSPLTGANQTIQRNVGPLVPGYNTPTQFMGRN